MADTCLPACQNIHKGGFPGPGDPHEAGQDLGSERPTDSQQQLQPGRASLHVNMIPVFGAFLDDTHTHVQKLPVLEEDTDTNRCLSLPCVTHRNAHTHRSAHTHMIQAKRTFAQPQRCPLKLCACMHASWLHGIAKNAYTLITSTALMCVSLWWAWCL